MWTIAVPSTVALRATRVGVREHAVRRVSPVAVVGGSKTAPSTRRARREVCFVRRGDLASTHAMAVGGIGPASADDDDTDAGAEDSEPEGYPVTPNYVWNAPGWEAFVKIAYVVVAALICNNILYSFFPYGLSSPAAPPALFSCEAGELLVMLSGVLLGAFDFGPQCAKQIRGGLKALDVSFAKQRQAAVDFLGLVLLKIVSDAIGLAFLAAPAALVPDWLPRSAGIGVALLGRSAFVENCAVTFGIDGAQKPVPANVRAIIAVFDRTLAFMAISVAYGTYNAAPYVAVPSAALFFAGAIYFAFGEKLLRKK